MYITELHIKHFRNITECHLQPDQHFNLIVGDNGSGKTSFIEALYMLSIGRSFRTTKINHILNYEAQKLLIFTKVQKEADTIKLGLQKSRKGENIVKLNHEIQTKQTPLTYNLPIQLMNPESFMLLNEGAKARCRVLDWGAFYNHEQFSRIWSSTTRLLKQRNAALKQGYNQKTIEIWDNELIQRAQMLDLHRQKYINALLPILNNMIKLFLKDYSIDLEYYRGWPDNIDYKDALMKSFEQDQKTGITHFGPHRADLKVKANNIIAQDILSRGQQKLFVCALKLAQGILFNEVNHTSCLFLIDDLPSELDSYHMSLFLEQLTQQQSQIFLTSIYPIDNPICSNALKLSIKSGEITGC